MAVTQAALAASYDACRRLNAAHGRTYYLATLLLPPAKRPAVHALYAFARYADEIVDRIDPAESTGARAAALGTWGDGLLADLRAGTSTDPIGRAVADTVARYAIPIGLFEDFLASMTSDLTVTDYPTYEDLRRYMWGSAAVIGLQMLPVLDPVVPMAEAAPYAIALGEAFQLTNFLRDVGEDLDRGRVYLPRADLDTHGVTVGSLHARVRDAAFRRLMAAEIDRTRTLYRQARPGIDVLHPTSRDCVRTAFALYGGILDAIERSDYDVLTRRVSVGRARRARVAIPRLAHAIAIRRRRTGGPATSTSTG